MSTRRGRLLKKRTEWMLVIFALLYCAIAVRTFYIQVLNNDRYRKLATQIRLRNRPIVAERGSIYDRVGRQLAANVPACAVYVHPRRISDKEQTAARLAVLTGLNEQSIIRTLATDRGFAYLARQLPADVGESIQECKLANVGVLRETRRVYPSGSLAAHVIGFSNLDGKGLEGIERAANSYLKGKDGYWIAEVDSRGRIIPETKRRSVDKEDGKDIVLTIDAYIQHVAEEVLAKSFKTYKAAGATAIVMDPDTGEILALANCPSFDPNDRRGVAPDAWRNRAITDLYEPGSTLKLVTVAAGLEEGVSATEPLMTCTNHGMQIGKKRVRCSLHHPYMAGHGSTDMYMIIKESCNLGAATLAMRLGPDKMHSYVKAFGLLDKPGTGLGGETAMGLGDPAEWPAIRLANVGFGQGVAVSAMQMAGVYSAIANGGKLMEPQIIREIRDKDGKVVRSFKPRVVRRVVSERTAKLAAKMLMGCVDDGTGKAAKVPGYTVAGKTGSAQKANTNGRGYAAGRYVASFMGFVPARNPRLVICVVVDEPKGSHWGATCAAPVFQEIAQKSLWYLKIPPDVKDEIQAPPGGKSVNVRKVRERLGAGNTG